MDLSKKNIPKIIDIKIMQGANYFSGGNVVVAMLDLADYDEVFTNEIPKFYIKLKKLLPSLIEHHCSVGKRGGFFIRVQEGTLLGHVTEHLSIELQTLAGMNVGFGKTRQTTRQGVYNVVLRYFDEEAGIFAIRSAVNLVNSILTDTPFDVKKVIDNLVEIREKRLLGPSTQSIVNEAIKRKIPYFRLDKYNLIQLGTGKYLKQIRATLTSDTNLISVETADDKYLTNQILKECGLPTPITCLNKKDVDFEKFVVKPRFGSLGKGISILTDKDDIDEAFEIAKEHSEDVIIQNFVKGKVYRLLVIDYKFVAAVKLEPPIIKGDGKATIKNLIEKLNSNPHRLKGDKAPLTEMTIDDETLRILSKNNYTLDSILENEKELELKISPNLKLGGASIDVTDVVHPDNVFAAERAARFLKLNVAGVDILASDIRKSIFKGKGAIIEVNAAPDFRMHLMPIGGKSRDIAKPLVEMLFPKDKKNHIPLIAITGSYGKTKIVKFVESVLKNIGFNVGSYSSEGVFVNNFMLESVSSKKAVQTLLKDPTIDICIAEISLESILNDGLSYQFADVGVVLDVKDNRDIIKSYVYLSDIEDVGYAKSVVAEEVYENGYTVLNADDEIVYKMKNRLYSKLILFSKENNTHIKNHVIHGGIAIFIDNDKVYYQKGKVKSLLINKIDESEIILPSIAILVALGIDINVIIEKLKDFNI